MLRKIAFASAVSLIVLSPLALLAQEPGQPVEVPVDFPVWGGISLSVVLNFLVLGLRAVGVIRDGTPIKKSIGIWLAVIGAFAAAAYGAKSGATADLSDYIAMIAGGAFAGLVAVGMHSTAKNLMEGLRLKK